MSVTMPSPASRLDDEDAAELCGVPFHVNGLPTVYFVHEISGAVLHFAPLARRLARLRDVIGLQSLGLNPGYPPDTAIEQMAQRYLEVVLQQDDADDTPCALVGYSMGGLIAFEMALRLADAGRRARLLLLDAPHPGRPKMVDAAHAVRLMARQLRVNCVLTAQTEDPDALVALLIDGAKASGALPAYYTAEDLRPALELQRANGHAAEIYRPARRFDGDVLLIGAGEGVLAERTAGWAPHVAGRLDGHEVDAEHYSLLREPAATTVLNIVEHWLVR